jgi:hypothetical protein
MADALRFAPWLLIAVAAGPAAAQSHIPRLKLQSVDPVRAEPIPELPRAPLHGPRFFEEQRDALPSWNLPFAPSAADRDRRGFSFSVRPGRGIKATARLRF